MHIPTTLHRARRRAEKAIAEIRAFCPTGPGGGIDNSCSPRGGSGSPELRADMTEAEAKGSPPRFTDAEEQRIWDAVAHLRPPAAP